MIIPYRPVQASLSRDRLLAAAIATAATSGLVAQEQFQDLADRPFGDDRSDSRAVCFGDVDGDGDHDVLFGTLRGPRLFRNDGLTRFTDVTSTHLPSIADPVFSVVLADLDADGDLDAVMGAGRRGVPRDRLYINDGSGTFTDATATRLPPTAIRAAEIRTADVDADGDLDLVLHPADNSSDAVRLYINDGTGVFVDESPTRLPSDNFNGFSIELGDFDGDGDLDIFESPYFDSSLSGGTARLLLNNGNGNFATDTSGRIPLLPSSSQHAIAVGDTDGDGDLDLTLGGRGDRFALINDGTGRFTDESSQRLPSGLPRNLSKDLELADLDGDGDLDLMVANAIESSPRSYAPPTNQIFLNNGSGVFAEPAIRPVRADLDPTLEIAFGDLDGDGDPDLLAANGELAVTDRLYLNDGSASFAEVGAASSVESLSASDVVTGDVDGDGDPDAIWSQPFRLELNDGRGVFHLAPPARLPLSQLESQLTTRESSMVLADVDADGDLDLVVGGYTAGYSYAPIPSITRLFTNDGTGSFTDVTASRLPGDGLLTTGVVAGDLDGDGSTDLLVLKRRNTSPYFGAQDRLFINDGTGTFSDETAARLPSLFDESRSAAIGDVDGDGDMDVVIGSRPGGFPPSSALKLLQNDGSGTFTDVSAIAVSNVSTAVRGVALGDIDNDGDLDLVRVMGSGGTNMISLNDGLGVFADTPGQLPSPSSASRTVEFSDLDRDGSLDLVVGTDGGGTKLYRNLGSGSFVEITPSRFPAGGPGFVSRTAVADVDRDGDPELLIASQVGRNEIYTNLLRQAVTTNLPLIGGTLEIDLYARHGVPSAFDIALPFLSFAPASVPVPSLGVVGIDPGLAIGLPAALIPKPTGMVSLTVNVPSNPQLLGLELFTQSLLVQWPLQEILTNTSRSVIY